MLEKINDTPLLGQSVNYENLTRSFYKILQKRSLIFFVGDLLDTHRLEIGSLAHKHEVVLIIFKISLQS